MVMDEAGCSAHRRRLRDVTLLALFAVAAQGCGSATDVGSQPADSDAAAVLPDAPPTDALGDAGATDGVPGTSDTAGDAIADTAEAGSGCGGGPACDPSADSACLAARCQDGSCAMLPRNEGVPCDDGNPCVLETTCQAGSCGGGFVACGCLDDADCAAGATGDLCAGPRYCEKKKWPWTCATSTVGAVQCDDKDDTACTAASCQPATATCALLPLPDATACDDGNACTGGEHQPSAIEVESSVDGITFSKAQPFSLVAKTLPKIPDGKRGDVKLPLSLPDGRYLRLRFTRVSWTFVDEVVFE